MTAIVAYFYATFMAAQPNKMYTNMTKMMKLLGGLFFTLLVHEGQSQSVDVVLKAIAQTFEKVNTYTAKAKMVTNVSFIKAPVSDVTIYYKKPNQLKIENKSGLSFIPKGSLNMELQQIIAHPEGMEKLDVGMDASGYRMLKLFPTNEEKSDLILATLWIDVKNKVIRKAKINSKTNGNYALQMSYGKYISYGLADKIVFEFNTKDYKLPKGVTFDYEDGSEKKNAKNPAKPSEGKVEITYKNYVINKSLPANAFK